MIDAIIFVLLSDCGTRELSVRQSELFDAILKDAAYSTFENCITQHLLDGIDIVGAPSSFFLSVARWGIIVLICPFASPDRLTARCSRCYVSQTLSLLSWRFIPPWHATHAALSSSISLNFRLIKAS